MKAKMLCTSLRKSRSVPSFRSSGRVTVNGSPLLDWRGSVRRGAGLRSALAFWRDKSVLLMGPKSIREGISTMSRRGRSTDDRQRIDVVSVTQGPAKHGVFQLHLKTARRANPTNRGQRTAEHHRAGGQRLTPSRYQVGRRPHAGQRAVLIRDAAAVDGGERAQLDLVPMADDVVEQPELAAERFAAKLLGQCDPHGFRLAIGVIGPDGQPEAPAMRDHHRLGLARGVRTQHLKVRSLSHIQRRVSVEYRDRRRPRHPDGGKLLDMVAQGRLVAAGPAGDDQRRDLEADPFAVALPREQVEIEHAVRCLLWASAKYFEN